VAWSGAGCSSMARGRPRRPGEHGRTIASSGLTVASATGVVVLPVPVQGSPQHVDWQEDDVVLLAVKSQDTDVALRQ